MRQISERYYVAPQLNPEDMKAVAEAGVTTVICNRPDGEVPASHYAEELSKAAAAAGLAFHVLPLTHQTFTHENIARQKEILDHSEGPVLAYCASGTRSTIAWAFGQAADMGADAVIAAAAKGGYDLANVKPTLDALSEK